MTPLQPLPTNYDHHKLPYLFILPSKYLRTVLSVVILLPLYNTSMAYGADIKQISIDIEPSQNLFLKCATLHIAAARLACYDKVANQGESTVAKNKQPLDIVKSVQASLNERKPKLVMADITVDKYLDIVKDDDHESIPINALEYSLTDDHILSKVGVTPEEIRQNTPLSRAYDLDKNSELGIWSARPYNSIYLMPAFATSKPNRSPSTPTQGHYNYTSNEYRPIELKAQLSVKTKVMEDFLDTNADLWFGYTQQMHWQVYNEDNSRPFRAHDYMPEVFITQPVKASLPLGGELRMLGAGAIHHSNGQSDPLSRSWNRLYLIGGAEWANLSVIPRLWLHVKEDDATDVSSSDNPDITDYYGHGDIKALYNFGGGETLSLASRFNVSNAKGAIQLDYTYPFDEDVYGYLQIFHGYGESIIDYNHKSTSVGVGITLSDWQGL